ncbi:GNAT family N-acetyltransferase [Wenzhouxiangella marina]|uniref:Acetyltransferase (GNAT) family protein n=1 Tax=Wenzhouxiangella marina TaxID=1579979 RepID=A0A0K0XY46_9GAMM|nr:GNAT family N-acetyltransferase [Wenzhouxiangella marina]AKS42619.1 Acetyltransferase (GNAT) family protein [Wenzhouxiangella marina]MBB6085599.1 GNAT superfamily N-acetyltransferase [Wenzhouxiangella marina]
MDWRIESLTDEAVQPWLDQVAGQRIRVFREWPYLYDGDLAYERDYLAHFAAAEGHVLVLARHGDEVIGCATAMAMRGADPAFQQPFVQAGFDLDEIMYFGESVLHPDWRGQGIGHRFFDEREAQARRLGKRWATFCAVQRPSSHPLRPADYRPLDAFWEKRGYRRQDALRVDYPWKDLGQSAETQKTMVFWTRELPVANTGR